MFKVFLTYLGGAVGICAMLGYHAHLIAKQRRSKYVAVSAGIYFSTHTHSHVTSNYYKEEGKCDKDPKCMALFNCINEYAKKHGCDKVDLDDEKKALAHLLVSKKFDCKDIQEFTCNCGSKNKNAYFGMIDKYGRKRYIDVYRLNGESSVELSRFFTD